MYVAARIANNLVPSCPLLAECISVKNKLEFTELIFGLTSEIVLFQLLNHIFKHIVNAIVVFLSQSLHV